MVEDMVEEPARQQRPKMPTAAMLVGLLGIALVVTYLALGTLNLVRLQQAGILANELQALPRDPSSVATSVLTWDVSYYLVTGLVLAVILFGFFRLRSWAWLALMAWCGLNLTVNLFRTFIGHPSFGPLALNSLVVLALNLEDVQMVFGIRRPNDEQPLRDSTDSGQRD